MQPIAREVHIAAAPTAVTAVLQVSLWWSAIEVRPEGAGARVRIEARAEPAMVAASLESVMLAEVCAAKRVLEVDADGQSDMLGKSM